LFALTSVLVTWLRDYFKSNEKVVDALQGLQNHKIFQPNEDGSISSYARALYKHFKGKDPGKASHFLDIYNNLKPNFEERHVMM